MPWVCQNTARSRKAKFIGPHSDRLPGSAAGSETGTALERDLPFRKSVHRRWPQTPPLPVTHSTRETTNFGRSFPNRMSERRVQFSLSTVHFCVCVSESCSFSLFATRFYAHSVLSASFWRLFTAFHELDGLMVVKTFAPKLYRLVMGFFCRLAENKIFYTTMKAPER